MKHEHDPKADSMWAIAYEIHSNKNETFLKSFLNSNKNSSILKTFAWESLQQLWAQKLQFDSIVYYYPIFSFPKNTKFVTDTLSIPALKDYLNYSTLLKKKPLNEEYYFKKICAFENFSETYIGDTVNLLKNIFQSELKHFIKTFPESKYLDNVILKKILGQFQIDSSENSLEKATSKVVAFKRKYPNSDCMDEADYWLFSNNATDNKGNYYCSGDDFLKKHPKSIHAKDVKWRLFKVSKGYE